MRQTESVKDVLRPNAYALMGSFGRFVFTTVGVEMCYIEDPELHVTFASAGDVGGLFDLLRCIITSVLAVELSAAVNATSRR